MEGRRRTVPAFFAAARLGNQRRACCNLRSVIVAVDVKKVHLRASSLIAELRRMAPEVQVAGGTFGHWMPHPRDVSPIERERVRNTAQRLATDKCLAGLLARVGLPAVAPTRLPSGARKWPAGYTGSVSHKGVTVAAAIASADRMNSLGIDIERLDGQVIPGVRELTPGTWPLATMNIDARTMLFSAQEAAYKAFDPILEHTIDISDIVVSWSEPGPVCSRAVARARGVAIEVRCSAAVPPWVVSAALWPVTVAPDLRSRRKDA